jgi:uncharacterized peroxidase-related enzyme
LAWVKTVSEDNATGELKRAYELVVRTRGKISNIMRALSLNAGVLRLFVELYTTLVYGRSGLSRGERETIALLISARNRCSYCATHHAEALRFYLKDDDQLQALKQSQLPQQMQPRTKAMVDYAMKLTDEPGNVTEEDLEELRKNGISESEILDVVVLASYMNFETRMASGLGVKHDEQEVKGYKY